MPEEKEAEPTPEQPVARWRPALARVPWAWPLWVAIAIGVGILLIANLPWAPWQPPAPVARQTTTPVAATPAQPAAPVVTPPAPAYAIVAWRDGNGLLRRGGVDPGRYDEFAAGVQQKIGEDQRSLAAARTTRLHAGLTPLFEELDERVSNYADWVFDWWTSWILLGRTFGWTFEGLGQGSVLSLPDRVQSQLVAAVQDQFLGRVLQPNTLEPKIDAAQHAAFVAMRQDFGAACRRYQQSFGEFIRGEARQVERYDPAQGWVPDPMWQPTAATFQSPCDQAGELDEAKLRSQLPGLPELEKADSPVNDVILRLARPFATKLISFVVLPVIVAAILGGFILPLFSQLPSILANIVTGVLTGALGALLIGLAASASVDWLLNRTDATLNRAGFEATVRKAMISAERDYESRVLDTQQRAIDAQMAALATVVTGKPVIP